MQGPYDSYGKKVNGVSRYDVFGRHTLNDAEHAMIKAFSKVDELEKNARNVLSKGNEKLAQKHMDDLNNAVIDLEKKINTFEREVGTPREVPHRPGETNFGHLSQELQLEIPGTAVPGRSRNIYPDFEDVPSGIRAVAADKARSLSRQLNIPIPENRILNAPWVGRVRNRAGDIMSSGTSQGWLRNESRFWSEFSRRWPDDFALIRREGSGRYVTRELAELYGWPRSGPNNVVGSKLVHHHIDNGELVAAIPEVLHRRLSGQIHATSVVVGAP